MTNSATLSHLRRINTPIEKSGKLVQPRKLHSTQWGIICPAETPEGASVGLVKNLALMASITLASTSELIQDVLRTVASPLTFPSASFCESSPAEEARTLVLLNGDIFAQTLDPHGLYTTLKEMKLTGRINVYTSIAWHIASKRIIISTEAGRCVRPLFVATATLGKNKTWNTAVLDGTVEYLDVEESSLALIAMRRGDMDKNPEKQYTHIEIDPSLILGVLAGSIPFSDHNQAPGLPPQAQPWGLCPHIVDEVVVDRCF